MASFSVPFVSSNPDSWGPPALDPANPNAAPGNVGKFAALPYEPFGRSDRLGRAADFAASSRGYQSSRGRDYRRPTIDEEGDDAFQLVDTTKASTSKRFVNPASKRRQHSQRLRQINARRQQSSGGAAAGPGLDKMTRGGGRGGRGAAGGRGGGRGGYGRGGGAGRWNNYQNRVDRQPSVAVGNDWKEVEAIDLGKLKKKLVTSTVVPEPDDVLWCGFLDPYNESYDKVTARQPVALKRMEHKEFYPVTTTDDPVLEKLAIDGLGQVFITDTSAYSLTREHLAFGSTSSHHYRLSTVLSHLMTCTRSVYPWDIVVQKLPNGTLFFDKRDNSQFDYLTVHETSYNPPTDEEGINTPERLGLEATMINQNFSQQILKKTGRKDMDLPNPFFDEDDADGMEPASVAFRYRKFALDDSTTVVCRTELHGTVKKTQNMTAFALNEYTPVASASSPAVISWRDKIDSQSGAVLATELKNNSFKLAKWTAQSLLAGADQMKIGFVSRSSPKNAYEHVILATQFYRPKDFATQITLSEGQMWAMFRMFVNLFQKQEPGKYVVMREPNITMLKIYRVPPETFDEDE